MNIKRILKELGNAVVVGIAIYIVFIILYYLLGRPLKFDREMFEDFRSHMVFSVVIYMANALVVYWFLTKYKQRLFTIKNLSLAIGANMAVSLLAIFIAQFTLKVVIEGISPAQFVASESFSYYLITLSIAFVISVLFYGLFYYKNRQEKKVKEQKIIAGTAAAKFDALKNQLDPHFLFNSLNVLTSLIDEDPRQAQRFTTSLSKVYRYVLEQKNKDLVSVEEELAFARTYVKLLKMRFEDSLIFEIPESSISQDAKIVPLSLQLLLENAVKHNVVTEKRPLHIKVYEEDGQLFVENNLQEKQVMGKTSGVGLQNIRQRYSLLSDREVRIEKTEDRFRVGIPVLTRQIDLIEPSQTYIEEKRYQKAKKKVKAIKEFFTHGIIYLLVILFLWYLNYISTSFPWAIFPTVGWGFGLLMHGMEAYGYNPIWGKRWEERKIRELMERDDF